ncbi:MAG TPA: hypothetical protein VEL11_04645 [Candidatus Bathyarchaeia archaeon]|nr:hypothetical protein [Candidatus Bathyarchaeia archaeon]
MEEAEVDDETLDKKKRYHQQQEPVANVKMSTGSRVSTANGQDVLILCLSKPLKSARRSIVIIRTW